MHILRLRFKTSDTTVWALAPAPSLSAHQHQVSFRVPCICMESAVRPAIKRIHDECRKGKEREKYAIAQVEYANLQMSAIDECIVAAKAWEELASKVSEMRKKATLDARFGRVIEKKLAEGSTIAE